MLDEAGAVSSEALKILIATNQFEKITALSRRNIEGISNENIIQHKAGIFEVNSYENVLTNHQMTICGKDNKKNSGYD